MRTIGRLGFTLLLLIASSALPARGRAQGPEWRLDVMAPRFGVGYVLRDAGRDDLFGELDLELRLVHATGHGVSLRGGIAVGGTSTYPMIDGDYVFRGQLLGDARLGLVLDVMAGLTGGTATDCVGLFGCTNGPAIDGGRFGGNAGASLAFEAYGFVLDLDVRYRLLVPTDRALADEIWEPEHVLVVTGGIGFRFY